ADRDAARTLVRIGALDPAHVRRPSARPPRRHGRTTHRGRPGRLLDVALLEETTYGRYAPHDLVRDFAREGARAQDTATSADAALHWYAAVAERVLAAIVEPGPGREDRRRPTPSQPGGHAAPVGAVAPFATAEEAFAWGDRELENVVALAGRYADDPSGQRAALVSMLVRLIFPFAHRRGRVAEMEVLGQAGLRVARRLGDAAAEA
ncbi:hypothetical protein ABZ281_37350, partial [Streptomyces sp. NPDC006265]